MIKPCLCPQIEFFSSRGQESQCLCMIQQQPFNCKQPYSPYCYHLDPITNIVLHLIYYLSIDHSNLLLFLIFSFSILQTLLYIYLKDFNMHMCMCASVVWLCNPWTVACQSPLSMEFSRKEYWSRLPFPTPGNLPNPGIEPVSIAPPTLAGGFFSSEPSGHVVN